MTSLETQLVELEREYWKAVQERDVDTAVALTDFPCIVSGPRGLGTVEQPAFASMMRHPRYGIQRVELREPTVRLLGNDVAVVAYKVHEEVTIDGSSMVVEAIDSSTWVRKNGQWRCAAHSEALRGDPFGRDRIALA